MRILIYIRYYPIIIAYKILKIFGYRHNKKFIPKGQYCYNSIAYKNNTHYVSPCPYYKSLGKEYNRCLYLDIITDDLVFGDQCKLCNINK